jgi:hypothetical protein
MHKMPVKMIFFTGIFIFTYAVVSLPAEICSYHFCAAFCLPGFFPWREVGGINYQLDFISFDFPLHGICQKRCNGIQQVCGPSY